ncbi:MAG: MarR family winged helix-turn-helix transcriptional regulator [Solirubrobacterales bacterium]
MPKKKSDLIEELVEAVRVNQVATDKVDDAGARALGVNRTDGRCLDVIQRAGRVSAGQLATEAGLTTGTITAVIDRLADRGYVRRVADPGDRRRVIVELTELAAERAGELWGPLGERGRPRLAGYSTAELELLIGFMRMSTELNETRSAEIREMLAGAGAVGGESSPRSDRARPARPSAAHGAPPAS